ncbi:Uma2 family endonuclease [Spirulina sp. CCNP1310]|uniref:Uma2 family endonuclease n=1 Tax=Spirulina sp. CCNP1310 TaxID=3110249 RepID=UPI002B20A393|nr:Uma2 family endonuclease [Spirulina sp. CCNP1310]MEA5418800.1 Uma2 family endonuclease [Spirulina sp. CCNP1310]
MRATQLRTWTVAEYHQMLAVGLLKSEDRLELLNGHIIEMSPQEPPHAATTRRVGRYLDQHLGGLADIRTQLPITLGERSEPEPDIAIARLDPQEYGDRHPGAADLFWVIEVADSTLNKDRKEKALLYGQAGIPEYWVLDVKRRRAFIFRQPEEAGYQIIQECNTGEAIRPLAFPDCLIPLDALFLAIP